MGIQTTSELERAQHGISHCPPFLYFYKFTNHAEFQISSGSIERCSQPNSMSVLELKKVSLRPISQFFLGGIITAGPFQNGVGGRVAKLIDYMMTSEFRKLGEYSL